MPLAVQAMHEHMIWRCLKALNRMERDLLCTTILYFLCAQSRRLCVYDTIPRSGQYY